MLSIDVANYIINSKSQRCSWAQYVRTWIRLAITRTRNCGMRSNK